MLCQDGIRSETKGRLTVGRCVLFPAPGTFEITARVRLKVAGTFNAEDEFMWAGGFGRNLAVEVKEILLNSPRAHLASRDHGRPSNDGIMSSGRLRSASLGRVGPGNGHSNVGSPVSATINGIQSSAPPLPPGIPRTTSSESGETPMANPLFSTALLDACFHRLWRMYPPRTKGHCELLYTSSLLAAVLLPNAADATLMPILTSQGLLPALPLEISGIERCQFVFDILNELVMGLTTMHTTANRAKVLRLAVPCADAEALKILANVGTLHTVMPASGASLHAPHTATHHGDSAVSWPVPKLWRRSGCGSDSRPSTPLQHTTSADRHRPRTPSTSIDAPDLSEDELAIVRIAILGIARWACQPHRLSTEFSRPHQALSIDNDALPKSASTGTLNTTANKNGPFGVGHTASNSVCATPPSQSNSASVAVALELLSGCVRECPLTWLSSALVFYLVDCLCHSAVRQYL